MNANTPNENQASRREFLTASAATITAAGALMTIPAVHAGGSDVLRVALIGCGSPRGGRGRGAAEQCCNAGPNVKLYAMADLFPDHLDFSKGYLQKRLKDKFAVSDDRCFTGWDAYEKVLALKEVDVVLLTTPPAFRPQHLKAAVAARKHIFAEKPVAVDAPGCKMIQEASEEAKKNNLSLVSGLCYRYEFAKRETMKRIHDGQIGDIVALQCNYLTGFLWSYPRKQEWSDVEFQVRNWLYFTWLSGDHNVEQHIHSLDKMAWAMGDQYPVKAVGLGGRQVRTQPEFGNIFDHHSVIYEFKNGVRLFAYTRQQEGTKKDVSDYVYGTQGTAEIMKHAIKGKKPWVYEAKPGEADMYQQEHNELIASIREGKPINNGDYMVKSTMMAIMGRMATYTGEEITWEKAINSKEKLMPEKLDFGPKAVAAVARPGETKFE